MRFLFFFLVSCFFGLAHASPVVLKYDAELPKFIQSVSAQVLKSGYVMSPSVLSNSRRVSINATVDSEEFSAFFSSLLAGYGVSFTKHGSVYYFDSSSPSSSSLLSDSSSLPSFSSAVVPSAVASSGIPSSFSVSPAILHLYRPKYVSSIDLCAYVDSLYGEKFCAIVGVSSVFKLPEKDFESLKALLPDLDKVLPRVLVTVSLGEVLSGQSKNFGLSLAGSVLGGSFKVSPSTLSGSGALSITGTHASLVLDQLMSDSRFKQLSSPSALAIAGQKVSINVGDRQPTLGAVVQSGVGMSTQSIVYQDSGVSLDVLPTVAAADDSSRVYLDMTVSVSSFKSTTSGVNNSPTISQRKLKTNVSLTSDEVVVLGGLTSKSSTDSDTRLFGVLPVGVSAQSADMDLLLVVSARVVE